MLVQPPRRPPVRVRLRKPSLAPDATSPHCSSITFLLTLGLLLTPRTGRGLPSYLSLCTPFPLSSIPVPPLPPTLFSPSAPGFSLTSGLSCLLLHFLPVSLFPSISPLPLLCWRDANCTCNYLIAMAISQLHSILKVQMANCRHQEVIWGTELCPENLASASGPRADEN